MDIVKLIDDENAGTSKDLFSYLSRSYRVGDVINDIGVDLHIWKDEYKIKDKLNDDEKKVYDRLRDSLLRYQWDKGPERTKELFCDIRDDFDEDYIFEKW